MLSGMEYVREDKVIIHICMPILIRVPAERKCCVERRPNIVLCVHYGSETILLCIHVQRMVPWHVAVLPFRNGHTRGKMHATLFNCDHFGQGVAQTHASE